MATPVRNTTQQTELMTTASAATHYIETSISHSTKRAYGSDWRIFSAWCLSHDLIALPAKAETVSLFLAEQANAGIAASTLTRRVAAIKFAHEAAAANTPTGSKVVTATLKGIRRAGSAKKQKTPATVDRVAAMAAVCPKTLAGLRDKAILLLGFAGAFRRSELAALTVADLEDTADGLRVTIRKSKTDQEGRGHIIAIPNGTRLMVVQALRNWLTEANITDGYLFRPVSKAGTIRETALTDKSIGNMVKKYAVAIGLDPSNFAGHSLRSGFLTSAAENGATVFKMAEVSRHKSIETLRDYVRSAELFKDHAGSRFL